MRADGVSSGISYQYLTRADEDESEGIIIHALNTVFISALNKWIWLDSMGNKENVHADFSLEEEWLAFPIRSYLSEIDFRDNNTDLDERLIRILQESRSILEVTADFKMYE